MELVYTILIACVSGALLLVLAIHSLNRKPRKSKSVPQGTVGLHQFRPSSKIVNISPPCLKLETFLRMAEIPFQNVHSHEKSSKGKRPWIEYNGKSVADSNYCVQFLSNEFGVDVDGHLKPSEVALARAFLVMLEENTFWTLVYHRWCDSDTTELENLMPSVVPFPLRKVVFWLVQRRIRSYLYGHGMGRHTQEEIYGIAERDLRAASVFLGEKKFLFGDKPCLCDASLFALVGNFIWAIPDSPQGKLIEADLKNLVDHSQRMKEKFYPDWDEIVSGKTKSK